MIVQLPDEIPRASHPFRAKHDPGADPRCFVIVGAGAVGAMAAQTLREYGFQGRVILISRESHLPYDRTVLSKTYLKSEKQNDPPYLRQRAFYEKNDIEFFNERTVVKVSQSPKQIVFADGENLAYDKLLLATGGTPKMLDVPGADLRGVFTLRSLDDADRLREAIASAEKVVIIGASFIALEAAAGFIDRGKSVTIVAPESVPFETTLGETLGRLFQDRHEQAGVHFKLQTQVQSFAGNDKVQSVGLSTKETIPADLVLVAIGIQPVTDYLKDIRRNDDYSVTVDNRLRVSRDIFAAGDIAAYQDQRSKKQTRIEHWRFAQQQGRVAAINMIRPEATFQSMPFFWTNQYDLKLRYVGHAPVWEDVVVWGDPRAARCLAFYISDGKIVAAAGCGYDQQLAAAGELLDRNMMPSVSDVQTREMDLTGLASQIVAI